MLHQLQGYKDMHTHVMEWVLAGREEILSTTFPMTPGLCLLVRHALQI